LFRLIFIDLQNVGVISAASCTSTCIITTWQAEEQNSLVMVC